MKLKPRTRQYEQGARADAAEATGQRIADAFLARLMKQWFDEITLDLVAADAGVTVQTVVRRFGGKEGLMDAAVKTMSMQINAQRGLPDGDIAQLVDNLMADYEKVGDPIIRLLALEGRHPSLQQFLNFGRSEHRRWISEALAKPLSHLDAAALKRAIDALVVVTDIYTWKLLRRDMARSVRVRRNDTAPDPRNDRRIFNR